MGKYQFVYAPGLVAHIAVMSGQTLEYAQVPLLGGAQALYTSSGPWLYVHPDWLGSARVYSTTSRTVVTNNAYAPFGENYDSTGSHSGVEFTGVNADTGAGYDFMFRKYNAIQGRWISPDPAGMAAVDLTNPQTWNRYGYVFGNPLSLVDPLGLFGACPSVEGMAYIPGGVNADGTTSCPTPICPSGLGWAIVNGFFICGPPGNLGSVIAGFLQQFGSSGGGGGGSGSDLVPVNPCLYAGKALTPADYAAAGAAANPSNYSLFNQVLSPWGGTGMENFYLNLTGFPRGHFLDPQPFGSGNKVQNAAYGNYAYGVYMQATGAPLGFALAGANAYAGVSFAKYTPTMGPMDANYQWLPAANVTNITNGYNAQANGTTCKPAGPTPKPPNG